jgi:hypothetical protein
MIKIKANLGLFPQIKQKYQKWIINGKLCLTVPTSEREGKLSNPLARRADAMHGENSRKFTETRARSPRAPHALISSQPRIQYIHTFCVPLQIADTTISRNTVPLQK